MVTAGPCSHERTSWGLNLSSSEVQVLPVFCIGEEFDD